MPQKSSISFFFEDVRCSLDKKKIISLIKNLIAAERKTLLSLNYIFCSDRFLHAINVKSLEHDTLTDVITFSYDDEKIEGEVYISLDRVQENAQIFGKNFDDELLRVIIHGALHLCGYQDKTEAQQKTMRAKEDFYLNKTV